MSIATNTPGPWATNAGGMSLAELEGLALANHPSLAEASALLQASQGEVVQAGLRKNPSLGYLAEDIGGAGGYSRQGVTLVQPIVTAGKRQLATTVARQGLEGRHESLRVERQRVLNAVGSAFHEVLTVEQILGCQQELVALGDRSTLVAEKLLQGGEISRGEMLQSRVESQRTRLVLNAAGNRYRAAWRRLAFVVGIPNLPPSPLQGSIEDAISEYTWEQARVKLLQSSPELARGESMVRQARCELALEQARRTPDLEVGGGLFHEQASGDAVADLGVSMSVPIFNRNQGNIRRVSGELRAAQQSVHRLRLELLNRLAVAYQDYSDALHETRMYRNEILPSAAESLDLVREGYAQGEFDLAGLLMAQRTFFEARIAYLESLGQLRHQAVFFDGMLVGAE